jgi:hypothetical protein
MENGNIQSWLIQNEVAITALAATKLHNGAVTGLVYAGGGLISASLDKTLLYIGATGTPQSFAGGAAEINSVAVTADGKSVLFTTTNGSVQRWGVAP